MCTDRRTMYGCGHGYPETIACHEARSRVMAARFPTNRAQFYCQELEARVTVERRYCCATACCERLAYLRDILSVVPAYQLQGQRLPPGVYLTHHVGCEDMRQHDPFVNRAD